MMMMIQNSHPIIVRARSDFIINYCASSLLKSRLSPHSNDLTWLFSLFCRFLLCFHSSNVVVGVVSLGAPILWLDPHFSCPSDCVRRRLGSVANPRLTIGCASQQIRVFGPFLSQFSGERRRCQLHSRPSIVETR